MALVTSIPKEFALDRAAGQEALLFDDLDPYGSMTRGGACSSSFSSQFARGSLQAPRSPAASAAASAERAAAAWYSAQAAALENLQVGDTCETLTMITLRKDESIFSDVLTELPAGLELRILQLSSGGPRRRARTMAGNLVGWVTIQTSSQEPLIRPKRDAVVQVIGPEMVGKSFKLECITQVRDAASLESRALCELEPGTVVRLLRISEGNARRAKIMHDRGEGWISLVSAIGQMRVALCQGCDLEVLPSWVAESTAGRAQGVRDVAMAARSNAEAAVERLLRTAGHSSGGTSSSQLRAAAREASVLGADPDLLARAEAAACLEDARQQLQAVLRGAAPKGVSLRAAVDQARAAGVPAEELRTAEAQAEAEARRATALQAITLVKDECKSVDMTSLEAVRDAKARIVQALAEARASGCSEEQLQQADAVRKRLHNVQEDLKGAIRIFCRVRPLSQREIDSGDHSVVRVVDATTVAIDTGRDGDKSRFAFDAVFFPGTQEEIFEDLRHLVQSAWDGYNVTIFAYGQTGAGKTHTMYGIPGQEGTAPRTIREIYDLIERHGEHHEHTVYASMMELYNNELVDLLYDRSPQRRSSLPRRDSLDIGQKPELPRLTVQTEKSGEVNIENLTEALCPSWQELHSILERGAAQRRVAATAMNAESSRSHLLLTVRIVRVDRSTGQRVQGKIMMCDLAGSERIKKSYATGERQKEAIEINKSLTAIGDVMEALTSGQKHVPYKNHKLTQVLQDSLGGTSKTLMFVNCSPASSNLEETVNALKYATRVKKVPDRKASLRRGSSMK